MLARASGRVLCFRAGDEAGLEASAESDAELQIVTECWLEPQYGQIINSPPQRKHYDGITYQQLPQAVSVITSLRICSSLNMLRQEQTILLALSVF